MAGGRTRYTEWLTPEGLQKIEGWARAGQYDWQIAVSIGIHEDVLTKWKKKYDRIDRAIKDGRATVDHDVESAFLRAARGYQTVEERREVITALTPNADPNRPPTRTVVGEKVVRITKEVGPNADACLKWLSRRQPKLWKEVRTYERLDAKKALPDGEQDKAGGVTIQYTYDYGSEEEEAQKRAAILASVNQEVKDEMPPDMGDEEAIAGEGDVE